MRTVARTAFLMAVFTMISKVFGFLREMVMANYFGATFVTDAYVMAQTILSVLFGGVISAISTAYVPIFSKITESTGENEGNQFTSRIINLLFLITIMISVIGILFSDQIVSVFAGGFTGKSAELAGFFVKVLFSYVIFSSTASIVEAYLQYKGIFLPQIISGYFISICTIAAIVISAYTSYYYLAFGLLAGYTLRFAGMFLIAYRNGYKHSFSWDKNAVISNTVKEIFALVIPTFIGSYMVYINQFVDKSIASNLTEGSIAALNYATLLNGMVMGVTTTILATIIYPKLTKANSLERYDIFNKIMGTGMTIIVMIALPFSLGAMVYNEQIVQIVYERGAFNSSATAMTSSAFFYYSLGLVFISVNNLMIRTYYSMHNMKTPMVCAGIGVIINIGLSLILAQYMAHSGLALATSIASFCSTVMLFAGLHNKYPHVCFVESKSKLIKIITAAVISVAASYLVYLFLVLPYDYIIASYIVQLVIPISVAVVVYLGMLSAFQIEETKLIRQIFKVT